MDGNLSLLKNKSHLRCLDPTSSCSLSAESYAIGYIKYTAFCSAKNADFYLILS